MILFILCLEAEGMKTDVIVISNDGSRMDEALLQADKAAQYRELEHRDALHLRLLTEETLGMMRAITGQAEGSFWIESDGNDFRICLKVVTYVDFDKRERKFLSNVYVVASKNLNKNGELFNRLSNSNFLIFDEDMNSGATLKLSIDALLDKIPGHNSDQIKCLVNCYSSGGR